MRRLVSGGVYVLAGVFAGLASAFAGFDSFGSYPVAKDSPWQAWNLAVSGRAYPYVMAHFLTDGRFPPVNDQMREFAAGRSSDGNALAADCRYVLTADGPLPHWWSLLATSGKGKRDDAGFISSDSAVMESDGRIRIAVSRDPASGNWIKAPPSGAYSLIYTFADPADVSKRRSLPVLTITRTGC